MMEDNRMEGEPLGDPSAVLTWWLLTQPNNWIDGMWEVDLRTSHGTVTCKCQGKVLSDYARDHGWAGRAEYYKGPGADVPFLEEAYRLDRGVIERAIHANDTLDREDSILWHGTRSDDEMLLLMRSLAPKYVGRAIAVYKDAGR